MADKILKSFEVWIAAQGVKSRTRLRSVDNISLEGIARLRELILDLAVRGKLVKQNAQDEPASSLLIKIAQEKEISSKADRNRKTSSILDISLDEVPFDLPKGWAWTRNAFLFSLRKGKKPKTISSEKIGLPYLDIAALDRGEIDKFTDDLTCPTATQDDILVVCDGSRSGLILNGQKGVVGSTLAIIETVPFLKNYIRLLFYKAYNELNSTMKGAAIPHLDTNRLLNSVIGLPPLAEQHRIVAKVEELMALCDELEKQETHHLKSHALLVETLLGTLTQAKDAREFQQAWSILAKHFDDLFTTEDSIDQLKQTILQLAVMGKLVPQDPKDEPASVLLERIRREKERLVEEGKLKSEKPLPPISNNEIRYALPKGWTWSRMWDLGYIGNGSTPDKKEFTNNSDDIPYLKVYNIANQKVAFDYKPQYILRSCHTTQLKRSICYSGDVLMNIVGPPLGKVAIVPDEIHECNINQAIVVIRPILKELNQWIYWYLCEQSAINSIVTKGTAGQDNISVTQSRSLPIALPPLKEQQRIVSKVNELFALCDGLKQRIADAQKIANQMAEAVAEQVV